MTPNAPQAVSPVNVHNEWDVLEEVVVGTPKHAFFAFWDPFYKYVYSCDEIATIERHLKLNQPYPDSYIQAASRAIDRLAGILEAEGVTVRRLEELDHTRPYATPSWETPGGFCAANPRDAFLVFGNEIIEAPMCSRSRHFEVLSYRKLFDEYSRRGARFVSAPRPHLGDELYNPDYAAEGSPTPYVLTNLEPVFDAADFVRCGRDIIGQLSHVTNQAGIDWLQRHLGPDYRVHLIQSLDLKPAHIDTTLAALAPGKLLVNANFVDVKRLPEVFRDWDVMIAPEPVPYRTKPRLMSDWISINTLVLGDGRIIVEERQEPLIRALKEWGFTPIPCAFEDYYPFIGGVHCATLEIRRSGPAVF